MLDPVNLGVWLISSLQLGSKDCPQVRWNEWGGGKTAGPARGQAFPQAQVAACSRAFGKKMAGQI